MARTLMILIAAFATAPCLTVATTSARADTFYAEVRGWEVFSADLDSGGGSCFAQKIVGPVSIGHGSTLRLRATGGDWYVETDWRSGLETDIYPVDVDRGSFEARFEQIGAWAIAPLPSTARDGLANGRTLTLVIDPDPPEFSLSGSAAAMLKVEECVERVVLGGHSPVPQADTLSATRPLNAACEVQENHTLVMHGLCHFRTTDRRGSFEVMVGGDRATVQVFGPGDGDGGEALGRIFDGFGTRDLGALYRDGACWQNRSHKICARGL
ncbi:MAG: hypothetical protein AAF638_12350 [Pseudomonadota bacterium]